MPFRLGSFNAEAHELETSAYFAVLRAFALGEMSWEKMNFLTELQGQLHISSDEHKRYIHII